MRRIVLFVALVLGITAAFFPAHADQGPVGVSITPLKWELSANAGATLHQVVTAINPNDFTLKVVPEFQDFRVLENAGIQWIPSDVENPYRMTDWIRIQKDPITLPPRGQIEVPFTIEVPRNASVGGHYAAIFFRAVLDSSKGNIGSIPRVGALIIFNVNGQVKKSGEITHFSTSRVINHGPVVFDLSVKNTGTTHYESAVEVTIQNVFGPRLTIQSEKGKLIYPGVSRSLKTTWDKAYPLGIYKAEAVFFDGDQVEHRTSTWFIGFPWKYFLEIVAGILLLRYLFRYFKKRFKIVKVTS